MEEYGIPREEIFVITKIYPNQFSDPEAAIDMALEKLDLFGFELTEEEMAAIGALDRNEKHDWY